MASLGRLIGGFLAILVGTTVIPSIAGASYTATNRWSCNNSDCTLAQCGNTNATGCGDYNSTLVLNTTNVTGAAKTVTGLVTLFYCLGVMVAGVALAVGGLRDAGLM